MRLAKHPNPIVEMCWRATQQKPDGVLKKGTKHTHNVRQGRSSKTRTYKGAALCQWLMKNGMLEEAEKVLEELKTGRRPL